MKLVLDTCTCTQHRPLSGPRVVARFRTSRVSPGAPLCEVKANLTDIRRDMVRMRRLLMVEGTRAISAFLQKFFHDKINLVCDRVEELLKIKAAAAPYLKTRLDIDVSSGRAIWDAAVTEVLGTNAAIEIIISYTPIVQSVAAKANERTSLFLGEKPPAEASLNILRRAQEMARQVTRINETTRKQLVDSITGSIERGDTIQQTINEIRTAVPEIAKARIPTIARTEVGNAIDHGTKEAIKNSKTVEMVEVIGCKAVEPGIPTFDGRPTCNIRDVPASRVDELKFHPNHTGAIVVQSFKGS